ncbi:MAG: hypothetical protein RR327_03035 [Clostridia bacterium]
MDYIKKLDRQGMVFTFCAIGLLLSVPVAISIYFDVWPSFQLVMKALLPTIAVYIPVQIIEIMTYVPLLGRGGSYLSFITGNISNLKAPAVMNALKIAEVDNTSDEGEIVATLAVATSSLVTTVMLAIGVVLFLVTGLAELMQNPTLAPAFDNLLAALFGGLAVVFIGKNWKIAIAPMVVMLAIFFIMPEKYGSIAGVLVAVGALVAIGVARILYKKGVI